MVFLSLWKPAVVSRRPESFRAAGGHCQMDLRNLQVDFRCGLVYRAAIEVCRQEEECALRASRGDVQSQR